MNDEEFVPYPALHAPGSPQQIRWFPDPDPNTTCYSLEFMGPISLEDINDIYAFLERQGDIANVEYDPHSTSRAIVRCTTDDADHHVLRWLQRYFMPLYTYTAVAQVFTSIQPMPARMSITGVQPGDYSPLERQLEAFNSFTYAHVEPSTQTLVVIFDKSINVGNVARVLEQFSALTSMSITLLLDAKTVPLIDMRPRRHK